MVHIRFAGRSTEVSEKSLELPTHCDDRTVLARVAGWLRVPPQHLNDYVVDRRPNGHLVVRPEAIYG